MSSKIDHGRWYSGEHLARIAFPLGGIGTGTISLGGRGELRDWEIGHRPAKGTSPDCTFVALRVDDGSGNPLCRVVEREFLPPFDHALGFEHNRLGGLPRFREAHFRGQYPFADIRFEDETFPVEVSLEAYSPFVPMDVEASSIPGFMLSYRVHNPLSRPIELALLVTMQNPIGLTERAGPTLDELAAMCNCYREEEGLKGIFYLAPMANWDSLHHGSAALSTPWPDSEVQTHVYRGHGPWLDGVQQLWDRFSAAGDIEPLRSPAYGDPFIPAEHRSWEVGVLCLKASLAPGETVEFPIYTHWLMTNTKLWFDNSPSLRNHVAIRFADAWDAALFMHRELDRLGGGSRAWRDALHGATLPEEVVNALSSQLSILRSQTVQRLSDGHLYAWEGCDDAKGSCAGNCTHVWNYEQSLAFLFPELERGMRRIDLGPNLRADGGMTYRCEVPAGSHSHPFLFYHACVDGQMGNIMQAYRDWRMSGDDQFLTDLWPNIRRALEFAWKAREPWDPNRDGIIEGRQHNTYDIEFYGPNPMLSGIYLGALEAAARMADHLGEGALAADYRNIAQKGRQRFEADLWNGDYFFQHIDVADYLTVPEYLVTPNTGDEIIPKYQFGKGCLSDQLVGQWEALVCGLGAILDPEKCRKALRAIFVHNFQPELRAVASVQRSFALQDEAGLILCSWPNGERPALPFTYSEEVWTGVEYQVAAHMIYMGLIDEALTIVRAARARYDGKRRNPWSDIECGHHYARALSSWSLLLAFTGARYDAVDQSLSFAPALEGSIRCPFTAGTAWGIFERDRKHASISVLHGQMTLRRFAVGKNELQFSEPRRLQAGDRLEIALA